MTNGEQQFLTLLRAFLRGEQVEMQDPDWPSVFQLGLSHNVIGIIAAQILLLPPQLRPQGVMLSKFTQMLGKTLQKHEMMRITAQRAEEVLVGAKIHHVYVKGDQIGALYPQPELRTSADTDIAVAPSQFSAAVQAIEQAGFRKAVHNTQVAVFFDGRQEIELHNGLGEEFKTTQQIESVCTSENGLTFFPGPVFHLVYVIKHLARHFESGGAGIKMFMDIDVLLTHMTAAQTAQAREILEKEGLRGTTDFLFYLCHKWFATPVPYQEGVNFARIYPHAERIVFGGGAFGFNNGGAGMIYLKKSIDDSGRVLPQTRLKALVMLLFPPAVYLKQQHSYAKCPLLLPVAWLQRLLTALFKRGRHSVQTVQEIMQQDEMAKRYAKVSNELKKINCKK